jgi:hypothetical protein
LGKTRSEQGQSARKALQRDDRRARNQAKKQRKRTLYLCVSGIIAVLITISLFLPQAPAGRSETGATSYKKGVGEPQPLMPTDSHRDNVRIKYSTIPATSGDHWSTPTKCGFYDVELRDEIVVHNMEHGNVIITHNLINDSDKTKLHNIHDKLEGNSNWLVTRPDNRITEGHIVMTAWGVLEEFAKIDETGISRFFDTYQGNLFSRETSAIGYGLSCASAAKMVN